MTYQKTLEEGLKEFDEEFGGENVFFKTDENKILIGYTKAGVKSFITTFAEKLRASVVGEVEGMKTNAQEFAPPKNCGRNICTSCPEMSGRVDGYKRAIEDLLAQLKDK